MSLVVKKTVYEKMTEGMHNVVITKVEDIGMVDTQNGPKHKAAITFTAQDQKDKEGKPVDAQWRVNLSLGAKSTLAKILGQLGYTNVGAEFDLEEIIGTKCQIVIEHAEKDGTVYANVASILKQKKATATSI